MSPHKTSADGNKSESQKSDDTLTFAIGDIHGRYQALKALVENCKSYAGGRDMRFVFLGDYVDRGSETPAVLEFLIDFSQRMAGRIICLRGNHEACLLAAAMGDFKRVGFDATMEDWLGAGGGGSATLISYGVDHASDVPIRHLEWLRSLR